MTKPRIADVGLVLSLLVVITIVGPTPAVAAKPLSIGEARLLVTGATAALERSKSTRAHPWVQGIGRLPLLNKMMYLWPKLTILFADERGRGVRSISDCIVSQDGL